MKKTLSLILALTLCAALAAPTSAVHVIDPDTTRTVKGDVNLIFGNVEKDLKGNYHGEQTTVLQLYSECILGVDKPDISGIKANQLNDESIKIEVYQYPYGIIEKSGEILLDGMDIGLLEVATWRCTPMGNFFTLSKDMFFTPDDDVDGDGTPDGFLWGGVVGVYENDKYVGSVNFIFGDSKYTPTPTPAEEKLEVVASNQKLTVNGKQQKTEIYNINGSNYFKLRDMAALLNGTGSQFSVDYDAARQTIVVKTGAAYTSVGGELATGKDNSASTVKSAQSMEIDGKKVDLTAYNIGGSNFFKLRDLGAALGFEVDYDNATATMLVKSK